MSLSRKAISQSVVSPGNYHGRQACNCDDCYSTPTISWNLVSLVMMCLLWEHTPERSGHINLHENVHTQQQFMTTRGACSLPSAMDTVQAVQSWEKNTNAVIKSSSGHKVFSALDLRYWSDYRSLFAVIMPKAVLKISAMCATVWCGQAHRY